ncbi:ATP-binding cassette domain-containing protein [Streptomyces roseirectus]|uniref:ATP-binding cassette domain-containing protein n=1 Tax=Streptomyces roseirectus TaxID=2768066 RepID=A0A7H0IHI5_9ACTN|nr:ATP-binding cassette domain-containing protein [Streptomyces roseirectus]QNP72251.1 ATP-binding cassette domain-containing protein [Streptomyces roseirectus]
MGTGQVTLTDIGVRYGRRTALRDVSLRLGRGVTGLLGPNGAGKTTLLRVLATASGPDTGTLSVLGLDPLTPAGRRAVRRRLGHLPQNPGLPAHFTAFEFVDYVGILKEIGDREIRRTEARRVLEAVGLTADRGRRIRKLSGGMRQRVALAAALVGDPELLVLDEPTVGLDPEQRLRFRELVTGLGDDRTVLLSTHQTEDVAALCQNVVVLDHGTVKFHGTPAELALLARGRVWSSGKRADGALAAWRTGAGAFRNIGTPPTGADLLEPTIEDGYLLLLDGDREGADAG